MSTKTKPLFLTLISLAAASPAAAEVIHIEVNNITYAPQKVVAHVGDTLEWQNKDFVAHTATARSKDWDINLPPHHKGNTVLKQQGHIDYYCKYHPNMKGEIEVNP